MKSILFFLIVFIITMGCKESKAELGVHYKPLFEKDTSNTNESKNNLLIFIGKKLAIDTLKEISDGIIFYSGMKAKYQLIQVVYGKIAQDIIQFEAYEHKAIFEFSKYSYSLIYVRKYNNTYYAEDYVSTPVTCSKNGTWLSYYTTDYQLNPKIKPIVLQKEEAVKLKLKGKHTFDSINFKFQGIYAYPKYGIDIKDVFLFNKRGVLRQRELF